MKRTPIATFKTHAEAKEFASFPPKMEGQIQIRRQAKGFVVVVRA